MWYVCPVCLERRGTPSYTGRGGVTRENTTTTDSSGYVIGLHNNASTRVGAYLGSGDEETEPTATQTASGVCPSQAPSEEPATQKPSEESASQTPNEEPPTHKPSDSPASQLTK